MKIALVDGAVTPRKQIDERELPGVPRIGDTVQVGEKYGNVSRVIWSGDGRIEVYLTSWMSPFPD